MAAPADSFVRTNPRTDRFEVLAFHHVELWCADAASSASRFSSALGVPLAARSDLSTGNTAHASHLLRSGSLCLLFTGPPQAVCGNDGATIPSFSLDDASRFTAEHGGPAVRAIAVRVPDAAEAFRASVHGGARPAFAPVDLGLGFGLAEVELYGDVVLRFVSCPPTAEDADANNATFLPGFVKSSTGGTDSYGLNRIDHVVGCLPELGPVSQYIAGFTGFHELVEFTAEDVGTAESGLNVVVLANNTETVLLNLTEPVHGTKRRSQIQTFLEQHGGGPGVQHVALASDDVLATLRRVRAAGGFEFLAPPPPNYYEGVRRRAGDVLSEAQIAGCQELGVLVDRDDQGLLLQIFTKPVGDRQTLFLEMIQRIGCVEKEEETGREHQRGACGGFGKGNFQELFKAVEEYEKSLERA